MLESLLLVISLCIDALAASFAYGANKIKIPVLSGTVMTCISTLFLMLSLAFGSFIKAFLLQGTAHIICFILLFLLGVTRLFEGLIKNFLGKKAVSPEHMEFKLFNFRLILTVYGDATLADLDHSKVLSTKESLYLGIALSLDSLAVGFGAGLAAINFWEVTLFSLIFNAAALFTGCMLGKKFTDKLNADLSWLSGAVLMLLAVLKLI